MREDLDRSLAVEALEMAWFQRRPRKGELIFHSDRGGQYASEDFRGAMEKHGIRASMNRRGNCSSTRKGRPIAQLQQRHRRLHLEYFPSYAPELNLDESVWEQVKRELANSCPHDVEELVDDNERSIDSIRCSAEKLRGCILQSELPPFLR